MSKDKNSIINEMGVRIHNCRLKMNLTQEELAEKADISVSVLSTAENGRKSIRAENLLKLSIALEVSTDYLLKGDFVNTDLNNLSHKLEQLPSSQIENIEQIINICIDMCNKNNH